jgi:hypothetical protein
MYLSGGNSRSLETDPGTAVKLPTEILEHILFPMLPPANLLVANLVCRQWKTVASRSERLPTSLNLQKSVIKSLFSGGSSLKLLQWFVDCLKYPVLDPNPDVLRDCLLEAATVGSSMLICIFVFSHYFSQVHFRDDGIKELIEHTVKSAAYDLGIRKAEVSLYKLLVYETGGHFAPHRDTEKEAGMVASLVVLLPSEYEGG